MQKFKEILQKQTLSVICGVVAVIAVVLCFYPTGGWYTELSTKVDESIEAGKKSSDISTKVRNYPNISGDPSATAIPLEYFPTEEINKIGADAMTTLAKQSIDQVNEIKALNQHFQLVEGALPAGNPIQREDFKRFYVSEMKNGLRFNGWPTSDAIKVRPKLLSATFPALKAGHIPTDIELGLRRAAVQKEMNNQYLRAGPGGLPTPESQQQAQRMFDLRSATIPDEMQRAVTQCKVYIQPDAIRIPDVYNKFLTLTSGPVPTDIWIAQFNLWIAEDVATGIAYANRSSQKVSESPIKRLIDFHLNSPVFLGTVADASTFSDTTAIVQTFDMTPTGRLSNPMYDVVSFSISLDVDATRISQVIEDFQNKQFITVTSVQMESVDNADRANSHFYYGNGPIAKLDLQCEELLMHDWLKDIEPPTAIQSLGATATAVSGPLPFYSPSRFGR